jgi:hypothetical protein
VALATVFAEIVPRSPQYSQGLLVKDALTEFEAKHEQHPRLAGLGNTLVGRKQNGEGLDHIKGQG